MKQQLTYLSYTSSEVNGIEYIMFHDVRDPGSFQKSFFITGLHSQADRMIHHSSYNSSCETCFYPAGKRKGMITFKNILVFKDISYKLKTLFAYSPMIRSYATTVIESDLISLCLLLTAFKPHPYLFCFGACA